MIGVAEEVRKDIQSDMFTSLIKADTQLLIINILENLSQILTYDVTHITNLVSTAILNFLKIVLTLIGLLL